MSICERAFGTRGLPVEKASALTTRAARVRSSHAACGALLSRPSSYDITLLRQALARLTSPPLIVFESVDDCHEELCRSVLEWHTFVVSAQDSQGRSTLRIVRRLREVSPTTTLVGCLERTDLSRTLTGLAMAGADAIAALPWASVDALSAALVEGNFQRVQREVIASIVPHLPPRLRLLAAFVIRSPGQHTVQQAAAALGLHRKSLHAYCAHSGLSSPEHHIIWCRLLLACYLLTHEGDTVIKAAERAGFPSAAALRRMLVRYSSVRPTQLRSPAQYATVLDAYRRELRTR
jgi:AraC-like DNA-binding protein